METNEKTMPVPDGWEFDRIDDGSNIVLKEKKTELPKKWEECVRAIGALEFIDTISNIIDYQVEKDDIIDDWHKDLLPLGLGKPMLALCQLLICRNAWWKPDWKNTKEYKWSIHAYSDRTVTSSDHSGYGRILAFPDAGTAEEFHYTFRDLIEQAKELL